MPLTTHFGLQSRTARLVETATYARATLTSYGIVTLSDTPFQGDLCQLRVRGRLSKPQSAAPRHGGSKFELFPLHSPLLGESWLVSFPRLSNMLKFSRYSCLI